MRKFLKISSFILIGVLLMINLTGCVSDKEKFESQKNSNNISEDSINNASIKPNCLFKSHMILQREKQVPVWGTATDDKNGKTISVAFSGQTKTATIENGKWMVNLDSMPANKEGQNLLISCENENITFSEVQVGEVWLASGQSNMAFFIEYLQGETKENIKKDCDYPNVKLFVTPEKLADEPKSEVEDAKWIISNSLSIEKSHFSTVAFLFARKLYKELDVPIGIICSSFGGMRIETWIPQNILKDSKIPISGDIPNENAYNSMINPYVPFAFRGMIWYQGEANCFPDEYVQYYSEYTKMMVTNIRNVFKNEKMPFIQIQLPTYAKSDADYTKIRFEQMKAEEIIENSYTTINYDTGNPDDIHPSDKLYVGNRIATMALEKVYNSTKFDNDYPTLDTVKTDSNALIVSFKNCNKGITVKSPEVNSLEICGSDGVYHQGTATIIDDKTIKVTSKNVKKPTGIRYGYKQNMLPTELLGGNLLPAKPFIYPNQNTLDKK